MSQELKPRAAFDFACTRPTDVEFAAKARVKRPFVEGASNASMLELARRAAVFLRAPRRRSGGHWLNQRSRGPLEHLSSRNYRHQSVGSARTRSQILQDARELQGRATQSANSYAGAGVAGRVEQAPAKWHFDRFPNRTHRRSGRWRPSVSEPAAPENSRLSLLCKTVVRSEEVAHHAPGTNPGESVRNDWEKASRVMIAIGIGANSASRQIMANDSRRWLPREEAQRVSRGAGPTRSLECGGIRESSARAGIGFPLRSIPRQDPQAPCANLRLYSGEQARNFPVPLETR
jgi:hypothetical protein